MLYKNVYQLQKSLSNHFSGNTTRLNVRSTSALLSRVHFITWRISSCLLYRRRVAMAAFLTALWESVHAALRSKLDTSSSSSQGTAPSTCARFPRAAQQWQRVRASGSVVRGASAAAVLLASSTHLRPSSLFTAWSPTVAESPALALFKHFCLFSFPLPNRVVSLPVPLDLHILNPAAIYPNQFPTALQDSRRTGMQESWRQFIMRLKVSGCSVGGLNGSKCPKSLHVAALIWSWEWASAWCSTEASRWSRRRDCRGETRALWDNRFRSSTAESHRTSCCSSSESKELAVLASGVCCSFLGGAKKPQAAALRREEERPGSHRSRRLSRERGSSSRGGGKVWITCQKKSKSSRQLVTDQTADNKQHNALTRDIKMYSCVCLMRADRKSYPVLHQRLVFVSEVLIGAR